LSAEFLADPAIAARHGFFTRRGGVSTGPYSSLNCSLGGGDDVAHVTQNRALASAAMGIAADRLVGLTQVHGRAVVAVVAPWKQGAGARADAMVTAERGLALGIITADCAPVLLHDAQAGVAGAAHAGWRGAAAGVLEATIEAMLALGAARSRIRAAVGPCIAQASYEVGGDLLEAMPDGCQFFRPGGRPGHWQFDLAGYCVARLEGAGVAGEALGVDTFADEERFFSHRRRTLGDGGPIGHQISVIVA
jgi:YfiH family protein